MNREEFEVRWEVSEFARQMERILQKHDDEKGMSVDFVDPGYSLRRIGQELRELRAAYRKGTKHGTNYITNEDIVAVQNEALDVANFAMMIYFGINPRHPIPIVEDALRAPHQERSKP